MKLIKTIARIALLATAVSVLTPGIALAADTYPEGPLIHMPIFCIQPDGTIGACEEEPPPVPTFPGGFVWDGVIVDPPIFDPGFIFPTDPAPGVEEPADDDAPVEEPADDVPAAEEPHEDAPAVAEPAVEESHEDVPAPTPVEEDVATDAAAPVAQAPETAAATESGATASANPVSDQTALAVAPGVTTQTQGMPAWMAALGGMLAVLALFGAHALGKRDA
jgi:hypothetical protein